MTPEKELHEYLMIIQSFNKDAGQDGQALHSYLIHLTQIMARANGIMAEYQQKFRQEKLKAYHNLIASETATKKYFAPSLAKDYVDAQCNHTGYIYDLAERVSRLCSHTMDAIRTIISSLKSERIFSQYGS